jgi:hypothetical protein
MRGGGAGVWEHWHEEWVVCKILLVLMVLKRKGKFSVKVSPRLLRVCSFNRFCTVNTLRRRDFKSL